MLKGIAVYSPHTALDKAQGGINDWLCEGRLYFGNLGQILIVVSFWDLPHSINQAWVLVLSSQSTLHKVNRMEQGRGEFWN
jgi:hypothetical protein